MKRDASRTRGELRVQLPAGEPPLAPIWARKGASAGARPKAGARRGAAVASGEEAASGFRMNRIAFSAVAGAQAVVALPEANSGRVFLSIRNSSASPGVLLVGFGVPPVDLSTCDYELVAGAQITLDAPGNVPQDDVWVFSTAGAAGTVSYGIR